MKNWWMIVKEHKVKLVISLILLLMLIMITFYFSYNLYLLKGIETFLRIIIFAFVIIVLLLFISLSFKYILRKNYKFIIVLLFQIMYIIILFLVSFNINKIYNKINNMETVYDVYSTSIITNTDNSVNNIDKLKNAKIGILNDENSIEGYQIAKEIIKEEKLNNELEYFDGYLDLFEALKNGDVNYIFVPTSYKIMFEEIESLKNYLDETKIIYTKEKKVKKQISTRNKNLNKPFTVLIMGVDSTLEEIKGSTFNGDALMLITFNPNTLTTTIVSIPRDTYVPIACFANQRQNKITHAAWYGENCMINTIEKFMDIEIDYYFKINFKGVVKLVEALGGVEVDVPYSFCEQDSNRQWGRNTVYVKEGLQKLNGEQALALSRNRKNNSHICGKGWGSDHVSDFVRGQNQQLVVKGIMNEFKNIRSIDVVYEILDTISNNLETNMTTNEILSFYNIGKDVLIQSRDTDLNKLLSIKKLYISGYSQYIFDYSQIDNQGVRSSLYNFVPYKGSIKDVVEAMKINLGLIDKKAIKKFSFNINNKYEEKIIGKGYYNEAGILLLPNFIESNKSVAVNFANRHNIPIEFNYITSNDPNHMVGEITKQFPYAHMDLKYVTKITIEVIESVNVIPEVPKDEVNCSLEENKNHDKCLLPNFVGQDYSVFENWRKKNNLSILYDPVEIKIGNPLYDINMSGKVVSQDKKAGTSVYDLIEGSLKIEYMEKYVTVDDDENDDNDQDLAS